jgi:hypothetical protein
MKRYRLLLYTSTIAIWLLFIYNYLTLDNISEQLSYFPLTRFIILTLPCWIILIDVLTTKFAVHAKVAVEDQE